MRTKRRAIVAALCVAFFSCASPPPERSALLRVEFARGFSAPPPRSSDSPVRIDLLLDVTPSMSARTEGGVGSPSREASARAAAARFLGTLPSDVDVVVHALGPARNRCGAPVATVRSASGADRSEAMSAVGNVPSRSEASLADALRGLTDSQRVVAFTDLDNSCGGDLCEVARELASRGVTLDLVVFGGAAAPACLEEAVAPDTPPAAIRDRAVPPVPAFRVETSALGGSGILRGVANDAGVEMPAGSAVVVIELEPPVVIGPVSFAPGEITRIQVLDFPAIDPPLREWRMFRGPPDSR